MNCKKLMEVLEKDFPISSACSWDHVGLHVGRTMKEITRIYVALDPTLRNIEAAIANHCDLLLTHHPLLFSPCFHLTDEDPVGERVVALLEHDMCAYAMHTNFDVIRMAYVVMEKLGITNTESLSEEGIGLLGTLDQETSPEVFCETVKKTFALPQVTAFLGDTKRISKVAIVPGAGRSLIPDAIAAGADMLLTGDTGHHDGLECNAAGMALVDAGHYGLEHVFIEDMVQYLAEHIPGSVVFHEEPELPYRII